MSSEVKRMLESRSFLAAVLIAAAAIAIGTAYPDEDGILETGSFLIMEKKALTSKVVSFLVPVVSVLPWCDSFLEEWKGGYLKSALPRMTRKIYVGSKVFAVALGGFLAWFLAGLLILAGFFLIYFPMEEKGIFPAETFWELMQIMLRLGLLGSIISSLGGVCAVVTGSSYLAFGFPFVGYYFCMILHERYLKDSLWLYPPQWIAGTAQWGEDNQGLWLFLLIFLGAAMGIFGGVLHGRLEEI